MKRLVADTNAGSPLILNRAERGRLTLVPDTGDDNDDDATLREDNIWRVSAQQAATVEREEERA